MQGVWLCVCVLFMVIGESLGSVDVDDQVPFTPITNAVERKAVCVDGTPAGYHFAPGSGDGVQDWLVYIMGGAYCYDNASCSHRKTFYVGTTKFTNIANFTGMLSRRQEINPDFYNWNRVYVYYCDQSSFIGDTETDVLGHTLQFRGSRNFDAVMEELLARGMNNAHNAMLAGRSAGGLSAILYCDKFRERLPNAVRVKCFSDSGFFIRAKDVANANERERIFGSIVTFHNLSDLLPVSCTKRMDPRLCLFPENIVGDIKTPLFILNSAFDSTQMQQYLAPQDYSESWNMCMQDPNSCTPPQQELIKDFGTAFMKTINEIGDNPTRGLFINTCFSHVFTMYSVDKLWTPNSTLYLGNNNMNMLRAVSDWYFDRSTPKLIDTHTKFPQNCNKYI